MKMSFEQDLLKSGRQRLDSHVNDVAGAVRAIGARESEQGNRSLGAGMPFNAYTGASYSGSNLVLLMLSMLKNEYADNRWVSRKQVDILNGHPLLDGRLVIPADAQGVDILLPKVVKFIIKGKRRSIRRGVYVLFLPVKVFNASVIEGFPPKIEDEQRDGEQTLNALNDFISVSGVNVVHSPHAEEMFYSPSADSVVMPMPFNSASLEKYCSDELRGFFAATGHESRECRAFSSPSDVVREQESGALFSRMASVSSGIRPSADKHVSKDFIELSGGEPRAVFKAAADSGRMVYLVGKMVDNPQSVSGPGWMALKADRKQLIEDAKRKLQGLSWYEHIANPESLKGEPFYLSDIQERAEKYVNKCSRLFEDRNLTIRLFKASGLFTQEELEFKIREELNKPLVFAFRHAGELFNIVLHRDQEIIEKCNEAAGSESAQELEFKYFVRSLRDNPLETEEQVHETLKKRVSLSSDHRNKVGAGSAGGN
jgi:antirestriction protein ArdC